MLTLGPIVAQVVSVGVADRTEGRYVVGVDKHYEASTGPSGGINLGTRHLSLTLSYGPSITATPLESKDREVTVYNGAYLGASYRWQRTTLTISEGVGYGNLNFVTQALAGAPAVATNTPGASPVTGSPPPTTPPPTTGGSGTAMGPTAPQAGTEAANQVRALNQVVRYVSSTTSVAVQHGVTANLTVSANADYTVAGAVDAEDQQQSPLIKGPRFGTAARYLVDRLDGLSSSASLQYAEASVSARAPGGNSAYILLITEGWDHKFSAHTAMLVGAGVGGTRSPLGGGYVAYSIYPTFNASITNSSLTLARGGLAFSFGVSAAPVVDLVTGAVDPRLGFGAGVGWGLGKFSLSASGSSAVSLDGATDNGAFQSVGGAAGAGYRFGRSLSMDGGIRAAWQSFAGQAVIPLTYVAYLGVSVGLQRPLNH
jgi:hypothetical protein